MLFVRPRTKLEPFGTSWASREPKSRQERPKSRQERPKSRQEPSESAHKEEAHSLEKPKVDVEISGPFGHPPIGCLIGRFSVDSVLAEKTTPLEWFPPISFRFLFQKHPFSWMFPGLVH